MKKTIALMAAMLGLAMTTQAVQIQILDTPYNNYPSPVGGEFTAKYLSGGSFSTFCLERQVTLSYGVVYNATPNFGAVTGGISGGNPDPVSLGTAFLYSSFRSGTLAGYNTGTLAAHIASSQSLQYAIWWLEGEMDYAQAGGAGNSFIGLVEGMFSDPTADSNGKYSVYALNLTHAQTGALAQDVLAIPDGGMTLVLLGLALTGLGLVGRRNK